MSEEVEEELLQLSRKVNSLRAQLVLWQGAFRELEDVVFKESEGDYSYIVWRMDDVKKGWGLHQ